MTMKKIILSLLLSAIPLQLAFAIDAANIKIQVNSAFKDNRYFMCLHNIGCFSIHAAQQGKTFPVMHPIEMDNIYVVNLKNNQLYSQGLPDSCNITIKPQQTITISGQLVSGPNNTVKVNHLNCSVS